MQVSRSLPLSKLRPIRTPTSYRRLATVHRNRLERRPAIESTYTVSMKVFCTFGECAYRWIGWKQNYVEKSMLSDWIDELAFGCIAWQELIVLISTSVHRI